MNGNEDRWARRFLVALVFVVPLVPNPGLFTNADAPKWAVLVLGALGVFAVILYRSVRTKDKVRLLLPEHLSLLALVVVAAILFRVWAADESASLRALALIGTLTALAIAGGQYLRDDAWVRRFLDAALAAGALVSAVGIAQWLAGASPTSTFGNPSFAAEFVAPSLCIAAGAFLAGRRRAALAAGIPMLLFLVLARSRADWVALAAGLAVIAVLTLLIRSGRRPPRRVLTGAIRVAAVLVPYVPQLVPLPVFGRRDTVEVRRLVRKSTLDMALDHKAVGVGLEGFRGTYPKYRDPEEARLSLRREVTFAHNLPLQVFAEVGVGGLLLLMLFLWVPISSGLRTLAERPADPVAPGATGAVVAVFVSAQLSAPLRHPASALLLFTLSALLVARRPRRFVTDLKGRYRNAVVVLLLLFPVAAAAAVLPKHLGADHYLARARAREAAQDGGMDAEVARLLTRSIDLEPGPDALRQLAFYRTGTGEPKRALALLGVLMDLSPPRRAGEDRDGPRPSGPLGARGGAPAARPARRGPSRRRRGALPPRARPLGREGRPGGAHGLPRRPEGRPGGLGAAAHGLGQRAAGVLPGPGPEPGGADRRGGPRARTRDHRGGEGAGGRLPEGPGPGRSPRDGPGDGAASHDAALRRLGEAPPRSPPGSASPPSGLPRLARGGLESQA